MNQRSSGVSQSLDLWAIAENDAIKASEVAKSGTATSSTANVTTTEGSESSPGDGNFNLDGNEDENNVVLFIGDSACGKSSLIQQFLKPNAPAKDPKPTVALEYNFVRKKNGGTGKGGSGNGKTVAHIWELGGDNIHEPKLIELPLSQKLIRSSTVILCVDLSNPAQIIATSSLWIKNINEIISKRLGKTASGPSIPASVRNPSYKDHVDESKVNPCDIPFYIFANKFDTYKTMAQGDKRFILQILRFIAHYHGATLIATSSVEPSMKESFRAILTGINFRSFANSSSTGKVLYDTSVDRPFYISAGQDSFENILLGSRSERDSGFKSKLGQSEQDLSLYITNSGLTKDCWNRLAEHLKSIFGDPIISAANNLNDRDDTDYEMPNEYPEPDVDAMRAQRELILERYIQDKERKEATLLKMNASAKSEGVGGNDPDDSKQYEEKMSKVSRSSRK